MGEGVLCTFSARNKARSLAVSPDDEAVRGEGFNCFRVVAPCQPKPSPPLLLRGRGLGEGALCTFPARNKARSLALSPDDEAVKGEGFHCFRMVMRALSPSAFRFHPDRA